jgi:predicted nucleic acid-binding Zn ribbon protein
MNLKIELDDKRYCIVCGAQLPLSDKRIRYCSSNCEIIGRNEYMRERMRYLRALKWTDKMSEKMDWLKKNQQSAKDIILDECWVCGSKENLILHHVKYYPICEYKVLCRKCHSFLHHSLLRRKKCMPQIVK